MRNWRSQLTKILQSRSRMEWLLYITTLGLLSGMLISLPLWSGVRTYPLVPMWPAVSAPAFLHSALLGLVIVPLLASLRYRQARPWLIIIALASVAFLCALDITRLQPWLFYYSVLLLISLVGLSRLVTSTQALDAARIMIGGVYLWSGVQKLNTVFVGEVFPWFTQPLWQLAAEYLLPLFLTLGLVAPIVEAALGLGLLTKRFRLLAIFGSLAMMLLVLLSIGPHGNNWNMVVWPWNVALFLTVLTLFWRTDFTALEFIKRQKTNLLGLLMLAIFWLLPMGNIFGTVDHYLSWSLYSGRPPEATLTATPLILESLSLQSSDGELPFTSWSTNELRVVPYPQERVFLSILQSLCDRYDQPTSLTLHLTQSKSWSNTNKTITTFTCTDL